MVGSSLDVSFNPSHKQNISNRSNFNKVLSFQTKILISTKTFLHSMEKKSTFLPYRVKKHHSTLEKDTF